MVDGRWLNDQHSNTNLQPGLPNYFAPIKPSAGEWNRTYQYPQDFDLNNNNNNNANLMYVANKNLWRTNVWPTSQNDWTEDSDNGALQPEAPLEDIARATRIAQGQRDTKYLLQRIRYNDNNQLLFGSKQSVLSGDWREIKTYNFPGSPIPNFSNITDVEVDPHPGMDNRIFISLGGINHLGPGNNRVFTTSDPFNTITDPTWTDMSAGLPELPISCLLYQEGSDDVIYAGTDVGVYRWDKPLQCWVEFNDGIDPTTPMPHLVVTDMDIDYCNKKLVITTSGRGVWETDLYEPGGTTNDITGDVVWTGRKYIKGDVTVRSGSRLTIQGTPDLINNTSSTTIYMSKLAKIIVEKGAKLKIKGAHVTSDCGNWHGIFTEGDKNLPQVKSTYPLGDFYDDHGYVILSSCILENAEEAFNNFDGDDPNTAGGIIHAGDTRFINNRRAAQFMQFANIIQGVHHADESWFHFCKFYTNDNAENEFHAHITMWDVRGIPLRYNEFYNSRNLSMSHGEALHSFDASYNFQHNIVKGFKKGVLSDWGSIWNNPVAQVTIQHNDFDENQVGLQLGGVWYANIKHNLFNIGAKQTPIPSGPYQYHSIGTKLINSSLFTYSNNQHEELYGPPNANCFNHNTIGSEIFNTGTFDQLIDKNDYTRLSIGNQASYNCGGTDPNSGLQVGLNYNCNINTENTILDFLMLENTVIRATQTLGFNSSFATGNHFSTICDDWEHLPGGNAPVRYHCNTAIPFETPSSPTPLRCIPISAATGDCGATQDSDRGYERMADNTSGGYGAIELQARKTEYATAKVNYTSALAAYNLLIDDGSTPQTVNDIENSTNAEMMQLRAEMLANSPYLSQEVLMTLAEENIMTDAIMLEILLANPEATRSEELLEYLEYNAPNTLPSYMIQLIRTSWTGASPRAGLEENLSKFIAQMTQLSTDVFLVYSYDSLLKNSDSALVWMQKTPSLRAQYRLIDYWLAKGNTTQAEQILNNLPNNFEMNDQAQKDHASFVQLYNFKKSLQTNNLSLANLNETKKAELQTIADHTDFSIGREVARSILCFFYQNCYPDLEQTYTPNSARSAKFHEVNTGESNIKVYPNPAKDHVTFQLLDQEEACTDCIIIVTDLQGRRVYEAELNKLSGMHIWDTRNVSAGTYIYQVKTNTAVESGKVVITK